MKARKNLNDHIIHLEPSFGGRPIPVRLVPKITKRLMWDLEDVPPGQRLLLRRWPKYGMETWVTNSDLPGEKLLGRLPQEIPKK